MARDFDGIDDSITATITAMDSGDWTIGAWINPDSAGESNGGRVIQISDGANSFIQGLLFKASTRELRAQQVGATSAVSDSVETISTGAWSCVFATFTASDGKCRIYIGTLSTAMAEATYSPAQTVLVTRTTGGTGAMWGNRPGADRSFDGRLERCFVHRRLWTLTEMEAFRAEGRMVLSDADLRGFWPLMSQANAEDLSGRGAHGTITGAISAAGPVLPFVWGPLEPNQPRRILQAGMRAANW